MDFNPVIATIEDLASLSTEDMLSVIARFEDDEQQAGRMALTQLLCKAVESSDLNISEIATKYLGMFISSQCRKRNNNLDVIHFCITHRESRVRLVQLTELKRLYEDESLDSDIISLIISCLETDETNVGTAVVALLSKILLHDTNSRHIDQMKRLLTCSSTIRCRVYQVVVDLCKKSSEMLRIWDCILERMIAELDCDDILMQMSVFELMTSLCDATHGFLYLKSKKVFEKIAGRIDSRLDSFSFSQLLKFLCGIATKHPAGVIADHPDIVQTVFKCIESDSNEDLNTGLQSLGNLAHSAEGKSLLHSRFHVEMRRILHTISSSLGNYPTDIKVLAFLCLCEIFKTENDVRTPEISKITKLWHEQFWDSSDFSGLLRFFRMPFIDIKKPTLLLLSILIEYDWGISAVRNTPCLIEYMLDRSCEKDKDILHQKFSIIKALADSNHIDSGISAELQKYVNDGPFYIEAITEIAYEES